MEFKGWVTDYTRSSFQGITLNEVMLFIGDLQKMVPNESHQYIDWNLTRTEQGNWPTKTIVNMWFKNETNLATTIGLLKVVKDELKKVHRKIHDLEVSARRDQPGMESAKILVSKDGAARMVSDHVVPLKGAVIDWVIQQCARNLERLGHYGQITLMSDQEASIVDVPREIANLRGSRGTLSEHSPVADSQSNGFIERGIFSAEEMTRVFLLDLSSRVGSPISVHSPVFPWIVEHATDILNKCHVASDGKSAYERLKRRQRECSCHVGQQ